MLTIVAFLGNSRDGESSNHGTKTCLIGMPLLSYLCDEMAKRGNVHFFRALIKLGIMRNVLENSSEYYEDFAETASKYGSNELAEIISMSSRYVGTPIVQCIHVVVSVCVKLRYITLKHYFDLLSKVSVNVQL